MSVTEQRLRQSRWLSNGRAGRQLGASSEGRRVRSRHI